MPPVNRANTAETVRFAQGRTACESRSSAAPHIAETHPAQTLGRGHGLAAVRDGAILVVTKLDRLARSLPDARDIADELTTKGVLALSIGGAVYGPTDPVGRLLSNVLGIVAEFEADFIRARTREGMQIT